MATIFDRILSEVCLDERIPDGTFDMSNNLHMEVLRENLSDQGIALNDVKHIHNKMLEGKFPERQAYNKDGLLVTFPTPAHKHRAIQRRTHFEQDPTAGQAQPQTNPNVFGGGQPPAEKPSSTAPPAAKKPAPEPATDQGSSLPASDSSAPAPAPSGGGAPSSPSSLPSSDSSSPDNQQTLEVEPPPAQQQQAPNPPPNFNTTKTPEERAAEAQVVKQLMKGGDNNPSFMPTLNERRYLELTRIFNFAKEMGYTEALKVISEALK
jgi:hypothetical protein